MDWAKAKTILIVLFLLLNIFLTVAILNNNAILNYQSDYARYAIEYLQSRDIHIEAKIPKAKNKVGVLAFSSKSFDLEALSRIVFGKIVPSVEEEGTLLIKEGEESILVEEKNLTLTDKLEQGKKLYQDDKAFLDAFYAYLRSIDIQKSQIRLVNKEVSESLKEYHFFMLFKDFILYEQPIHATISQEGMMTLTLPTREVKRMQPSNEILSVYQIMVMGQLPEGSTLVGVDFGYKKIGLDDFFDSPVWHIRLKDGQSLYYNAYTGEKVQ